VKVGDFFFVSKMAKRKKKFHNNLIHHYLNILRQNNAPLFHLYLLTLEMGTEMEAAPVLSTPDDRILEATEPAISQNTARALSDEELAITYDIDRTLKEIREARYKRIALQFPDDMLPDAPRVFQLLSRGLDSRNATDSNTTQTQNDGTSTTVDSDGLAHSVSQLSVADTAELSPRLYILADTSYGTCCADEVAAEHVDADVVVHYGRSCLSPTSRLPVIYVFTHKPLPIDPVVRAFKGTYPDPTTKVILAADVTYTDHIPAVHSRLVQEGYTDLFGTEVLHDPSSAIPNRTVPDSVRETPESLSEWQLFHISDPPTALLMTLASRVSSIHIYPTNDLTSENVKPSPASNAIALRRRYAILTSLSTVPIFGILINTLSVKNYLHIVEHVKQKIAEAGKKSYLFVVGKLNAAKVANFSEIGGWVVIGCWESSLVDSKDFWKPVITPFELELALKGDAERVWTGAWQSDFQSVLDQPTQDAKDEDDTPLSNGATVEEEDDMSESESAPPEFDLRTGRYVSHSRPMLNPAPHISAQAEDAVSAANGPSAARALARRAKGDLAMVGGTFSPGAEFLRSQRTWKGLGSDFDIQYEDEDTSDSMRVVEGRKGIARGYTVGDSIDRH
jgi:diphthamide biosynthesis protein 2